MFRISKLIEELYMRQEGNLAYYDVLTSVYNRNWYERFAKREFSSRCYVIFIDMDNMKSINDLRGHLAGDEAIKNLSERLREEFSAIDDYICRWGGDEFLIFSCSSDRQSIVNRLETFSNCSYGLCYRMENEDISSCLDKADEELYKMKKYKRVQRVL